MMHLLTGSATTAHASKYLQQLCKHWSHRFEVSFDALQGRVAMPPGPLTLEAAPGALHLRLELAEAHQAERMRAVVEDHLNRFAHKEAPLAFTWRGEAPQ